MAFPHTHTVAAQPASLSSILVTRMASYSHSFEDGVNTILCRC